MFEVTERLSLVIYLYYRRDAKKVIPYGDFAYQSSRGRYVVIYVDADQATTITEQLTKEKYVKKVLPSYIKNLDQDFVGSLWREPIAEQTKTVQS